jgi:hypothetical protein
LNEDVITEKKVSIKQNISVATKRFFFQKKLKKVVVYKNCRIFAASNF